MKTNKLSRRSVLATASALTVLAVALAGAYSLSTQPAEANAAPAAPPAMPVAVATVAARDVAGSKEYSGRLEAVERVELRSRAAGTVQAVHFREGMLVRPGDLLFSIDPAPYAAEVERAEAQSLAARSRLAYADSELDRARRLWEERAIAQREFDERSHARREAEANLRAADAALQSARLNLGYTQVRAPIAGRIGRVEINVGNLVAAGPGAPVLTTLVSVSPIYASFDAEEQTVVQALKALPGGARTRAQLERIPVQMGTAATTELPHAGHLQLVHNEVDTQSGTIRVRAIFDNPDGSLMPGQFARLRLGQLQPERVLLINERAVGTDQDKRFVIVVGADNKAVWREVKLGPSVNGLRVVREGLQAGERIVVNGLHRVRPGADVAPRDVAMDSKSELAALAGKAGTT